ncbi:aspartate kinase [Alicyclobacillus sp. SO9]|uniref:aspartate kinase n=1 Tax=Alicyclobacillus sp. SO9 TaxID=2665646 RepID=UPI0018E7D2D6|nr:aspartate kinase [Alicyclobacillus sp. SO9]QQE79176.1 aspartate kinase [Alicyclobacillus sp. SO9]
MKLIVQKYGGTSVASHESRLAAARHIEEAVDAGYGVAVIVSAMGRKGDPYATDTLLGTVSHSQVTTKRDLDMLISCGEAISAVVFASLLRSRGHQVTVLSGQQAGIITNNDYGDARILDIQPTLVTDALQRREIVVLMGFQGVTEDGDITTLGRGGSDTTATALGAVLNADYVEIFTDVDGVMTADPKLVPNASVISNISYAESFGLCSHGAQIIHPRAVQMAMQKNVPIRVRGTKSDSRGTIINNTSVAEDAPLEETEKQEITGITQESDLTQMSFDGHHVSKSDVLSTVVESGLSVEFFSTNQESLSFVVSELYVEPSLKALKEKGIVPEKTSECAKIAIVYTDFANKANLLRRVIEIFLKLDIEVHSSGDSHSAMWFLVDKKHMGTCVNELHKEFFALDDASVLVGS